MICCNTGARTRRLMMTRVRFRAYGVHRVLDELPEVLGIRQSRRCFPLTRSLRPTLLALEEPSLRVVYRRSRWRWGRDTFKILLYVKNTLFPRLTYPYAFSRDARPHIAARTRVQHQPREQLNFLSPTSPPVIHLDLETILYAGGGRVWFLWRRKDIQWSISFFLLFFLSLSLSRTRERAYLMRRWVISVWFSCSLASFHICQLSLDTLLLLTLTANINIGSDNVLPRGARRIPEKFIRLARTFCVC